MEAANLSVASTGVAPFAWDPKPRAAAQAPAGSSSGAALPGREPPFSVFTALVVTQLVLLVAATFLWNLLVLVTILRVQALHRVPHNVVASTAVSDVLVAALVMPLSLVSELSAGRRWRLRRSLCHVWISFDVLRCPASIWNVAAIALARYWTITRHLPYTPRTRRRASVLLIALTWALSALIALAPLLFGWGEANDARLQRYEVSQEPSYAVFSTCGAFYLPLGVVLSVYWKIYKAAKFRVGRRRRAVLPLPATVQARRGLSNGDLGKRVAAGGESLAKGRAGGESLRTWRTRGKVGPQRSRSGRGVCHLLSCSAHRGAHHLRLARTRRVRHLRRWCAREKGFQHVHTGAGAGAGTAAPRG
eukprot:bmy_18640T0